VATCGINYQQQIPGSLLTYQLGYLPRFEQVSNTDGINAQVHQTALALAGQAGRGAA